MNSGTGTITAGIDGSRASLDAADWAAREAGRRRLPLRLLHADIRHRVPARVPDVDVPAGCTRSYCLVTWSMGSARSSCLMPRSFFQALCDQVESRLMPTTTLSAP